MVLSDNDCSLARVLHLDSSIWLLFPVFIIRFAIAFPIFYYWNQALEHESLIESHDELQQEYFAPIAKGEYIAATWAVVLHFWNVAMWIPGLFVVVPPFNLPIAVVNTLLTGCIILATCYQTTYAPYSTSYCGNNAHDVIRPGWQAEGFYETAARMRGITSSGHEMCMAFVREWKMGVAISALYSIISLLEFIAFARRLRYFRILYEHQKYVLQTCGRGFLELITHGPTRIFRYCLPIKVKSRIRVARRFAIKAATGLKQKISLELSALRKAPKKVYADTDGDEVTSLAGFLGIYDVLILVARELHYLDIVMLARTCKSVRRAVLPTNEFEHRQEVLKLYTCSGSSPRSVCDGKRSCWLCTNQICMRCEHLIAVPEQNLDHHLDNCHPYCTACYNRRVLRRLDNSDRRRWPHCQCAPIPFRNPLGLVWRKGTRTQQQVEIRWKSVCRECKSMDRKEVFRIRDKRTRLELKLGLKPSGGKWTQCGRPGCGKELGAGPRWWVCRNPMCSKECVSLAHDAWGQRCIDVDNIKKGFEDEAV